jgi:hypothetical protein
VPLPGRGILRHLSHDKRKPLSTHSHKVLVGPVRQFPPPGHFRIPRAPYFLADLGRARCSTCPSGLPILCFPSSFPHCPRGVPQLRCPMAFPCCVLLVSPNSIWFSPLVRSLVHPVGYVTASVAGYSLVVVACCLWGLFTCWLVCLPSQSQPPLASIHCSRERQTACYVGLALVLLQTLSHPLM